MLCLVVISSQSFCQIGQLSFLCDSGAVQILDVNPEDEAEEDGANVDLDSQRKGKCVVLKTSTRQVSALYVGSSIFEYTIGHNYPVYVTFSLMLFLLWVQTIFLPVVGLVDPDSLKPGDLVGVNKDSYLILDTLPSEYDSRVKAMEVDEKPTEVYSDIGGLDKQVSSLSTDA